MYCGMYRGKTIKTYRVFIGAEGKTAGRLRPAGVRTSGQTSTRLARARGAERARVVEIALVTWGS